MIEAVSGGELDLGVVTRPVGQAVGEGELSRLEVEPWLVDELRLIVPPSHPLSGQESFGWEALDGLPLVLFEAGSAVRELLDRHLGRAHIQPEIVMELRSIESIKQMVAQGIGAAFVSRFALSDPDQGLRAADGPLERQLAVVYRADRTLGAAAQAFLAMMDQAVPAG